MHTRTFLLNQAENERMCLILILVKFFQISCPKIDPLVTPQKPVASWGAPHHFFKPPVNGQIGKSLSQTWTDH